MSIISFRIAATAILTFACPPLFAHPGHGAVLMDGLLHPYAGIDHLLVALAVGLWAVHQDRTARYAIPAAFLLSLACGTAFGAAGYTPAWLEQGIAVSLMTAGLLVTFAVRLYPLFALTFASAGALLHGFAHGAEMTASAGTLPFSAGLMLGTSILLFAGMAAGTRLSGNVHTLRLAGASAAACGIVLAIQTL